MSNRSFKENNREQSNSNVILKVGTLQQKEESGSLNALLRVAEEARMQLSEYDQEEKRLVIDTGVKEELRGAQSSQPQPSKQPAIPRMKLSMDGSKYKLTSLPPIQLLNPKVEDTGCPEPMEDDDLDNLDCLDDLDEPFRNSNPYREINAAHKKGHQAEEEKFADKVECRLCHNLYGKYFINKHMSDEHN